MCADDNNLSTGDKFLQRTNNSSFITTVNNKTGKKRLPVNSITYRRLSQLQ